MKETPVSADKVKRYFLLANAGKELFKPMVCNGLEERYKRILDEIYYLTSLELDERITDKVRLARYDSFEWYRGQLPLGDIGSWPEMCGLDIRLTKGNILDTSQAVQDAREGGLVLSYERDNELEKRISAFRRFLEKSDSIRTNLDLIYERFPIILFPGGEVREKDYNSWARKNNALLCQIFEYDLDDGNSRAVSYSLEGIDSAPCFYGISKK